jgi:hypothetical protein
MGIARDAGRGSGKNFHSKEQRLILQQREILGASLSMCRACAGAMWKWID